MKSSSKQGGDNNRGTVVICSNFISASTMSLILASVTRCVWLIWKMLRFLKNFELGSKLEPERKMQMARALGLQPRQIAIWFQNRRARWKTKQLERDNDILKRQFDALKADNDSLK